MQTGFYTESQQRWGAGIMRDITNEPASSYRVLTPEEIKEYEAKRELNDKR